MQEDEGTGSGFIWDTGGDIVTNFHVVKERRQGSRLRDSDAGRTMNPSARRLIGVAPNYDLAVLAHQRCPPTSCLPMPIGEEPRPAGRAEGVCRSAIRSGSTGR